MKIGLLTDAPRHNLALMRVARYYEKKGDMVVFNMPLEKCHYTIGSWLFHENYSTDYSGGPASRFPSRRLEDIFRGVEEESPLYRLYPGLDYSLGITWEYCPRKCPWCVVPRQKPPMIHRSVFDIHEGWADKICLLNNNTFSDPRWRETFQEIYDLGLTVVDQNGYDIRLIDEEKVVVLNSMHFEGRVYFSWDDIADEAAVRSGMQTLKQYGFRHPVRFYVLVGYPEGSPVDDTVLHRLQVIADAGFEPFVMLYNNSHNEQLRWLRWMVNWSFHWRKVGFKVAWEEGYRPERRRLAKARGR